MLEPSGEDLSFNQKGQLSQNQRTYVKNKLAAYQKNRSSKKEQVVNIVLLIGIIICLSLFLNFILAIEIVALFLAMALLPGAFSRYSQYIFYWRLAEDLKEGKVVQETNNKLGTTRRFSFGSLDESMLNSMMAMGTYYKLPRSGFVLNNESATIPTKDKVILEKRAAPEIFDAIKDSNKFVNVSIPFDRGFKLLLIPMAGYILLLLIGLTLLAMGKSALSIIFSVTEFVEVLVSIVILLLAIGACTYSFYYLYLYSADAIFHQARLRKGKVLNLRLISTGNRHSRQAFSFEVNGHTMLLDLNDGVNLIENKEYLFFILRFSGRVLKWLPVIN